MAEMPSIYSPYLLSRVLAWSNDGYSVLQGLDRLESSHFKIVVAGVGPHLSDPANLVWDGKGASNSADADKTSNPGQSLEGSTDCLVADTLRPEYPSMTNQMECEFV